MWIVARPLWSLVLIMSVASAALAAPDEYELDTDPQMKRFSFDPSGDPLVADAAKLCAIWDERVDERANEPAGRSGAGKRPSLASLKRVQAACRAEAKARTAKRRALAATRPLDEILAIPKELRIADEQQRVIDAEEQRADEVAKKHADPKLMRPVLSAALCKLANARRDTLGEIANEKKYAKVGGVVDKEKMYGLQERLRAIDEATVTHRERLRELKIQSLGCGAAILQRLAACADGGAGGSCEEAPMREMLELLPALPQ